MRRRNNPWPAFSDLFSLLMLLTLGVAVFLHGSIPKPAVGEGEPGVVIDEIRAKVNQVASDLAERLRKEYGIRVEKCTDESACLDLGIAFALNDATIETTHLPVLAEVCQKIKNAIDEVQADRRYEVDGAKLGNHAIEVIVEGHTDSQQPHGVPDERAEYLFNWELSSRRAQSVLYEFKRCGLALPTYQVVSLGYADSKPKCRVNSQECYRKNRRTTIKLLVNHSVVRRSLSRGGGHPIDGLPPNALPRPTATTHLRLRRQLDRQPGSGEIHPPLPARSTEREAGLSRGSLGE